MKKFLLSAAVVACAAFAANAQDACYVIGEAGALTLEAKPAWSPAVGYALEKTGDGVFSGQVKVFGYFGIAMELDPTEDWDNFNANMRLYPADGVQMITFGDDGKAVIELSTEKIGGDSWTMGNTDPTEATITVDYNNMTLTVAAKVEVDKDIYLKGDVNTWEAVEGYKFEETSTGIYELKGVTVVGGFKLATPSWAEFNFGAPAPAEGEEVAPVKFDEVYTVWNDGNSNNLVINDINDITTEYTNVNLKLDINNNTLLVTKGADGIEGVEIDANAPATYYNLQGVEVANPANGLYIVKQGDKVAKILVK